MKKRKTDPEKFLVSHYYVTGVDHKFLDLEVSVFEDTKNKSIKVVYIDVYTDKLMTQNPARVEYSLSTMMENGI